MKRVFILFACLCTIEVYSQNLKQDLTEAYSSVISKKLDFKLNIQLLGVSQQQTKPIDKLKFTGCSDQGLISCKNEFNVAWTDKQHTILVDHEYKQITVSKLENFTKPDVNTTLFSLLIDSSLINQYDVLLLYTDSSHHYWRLTSKVEDDVISYIDLTYHITNKLLNQVSINYRYPFNELFENLPDGIDPNALMRIVLDYDFSPIITNSNSCLDINDILTINNNKVILKPAYKAYHLNVLFNQENN